MHQQNARIRRPRRPRAGHEVAIYLPTTYVSKAKFPVMFFFDPHGSGAFAIEKYINLAEEYHCILIGSNDSKNGMDLNESYNIASELLNDATKIFSIDEQQIVFCGFSGGSKVAINAALQLQNVSKVVYCGAALPIQNCNHSLQMLGFAGIRDMNYSQMVQFAISPLPSTIKNYSVEWYGKHEWPDAATFETAFYFLNNEIDKIPVAKFGDDKVKMIQDEQRIQQQYIEGLHNYDVNYWAREILKLNNQKLGDKTGTTDRLLSYISLACYSLSNQMLQQNLFDQAGKILTIYKMADPTNSDCDFLQAELYAKENNPSKVYNTLRMAVQNGLKDFNKIENEPIFVPYLNTDEMKEIRQLLSK